jgi:hypothetical protein
MNVNEIIRALAKQNPCVLSRLEGDMRRDADPTRQRRAVLLVAASLAAAWTTSGCLSGPLSEGNAAQPHLERKVFAISCEDGRRYAAKTLKARSYRITGVERSGADTTVEGRNDTDRVTSRLTVTCGADGVTVQPSGSSQWIIDGLRFGFYQIADAGDRVWPPPQGPVVKMELYRGPEAKIEFPTDLEPLGVVAVRVRVLNAGERAMRIDPRRVRATTEAGAPAVPLAGAEAERKLASVDPDIKSKLLKPSKLKQGESVTGFVFFPAGNYTGGALALIDDQTGEADDYDVNFASS